MMISKDQEDKLISLALNVRNKSYAPYSKFKVGSAVLTKNNNYYVGCNVEDSSLTMTMHAEINAINQAIINGEKKIKAIAVVTDSKEPVAPCGICRQVLSEFNDEDVNIICVNLEGVKKYYSLKELYPKKFKL